MDRLEWNIKSLPGGDKLGKRDLILIIFAFLWLFFPRFSVGPIPFIDFFAKYAKQWPNAILEPESEYIRDSGLGQILFRLIPVDGFVAFGILHLAILLVAFYFLWELIQISLPKPAASSLFRILILGQLGFVLFRWIGSYDAITFLLWVLALHAFLRRSHLGIALVFTLLGFQHFEQSMIGASCLFAALYWVGNYSELKKSLLVSFIGLVLGKGLLFIVLYINGQTGSGRNYYFTKFFIELGMQEVYKNLPLYIFSLFGAIWLLVIPLIGRLSFSLRVIPLAITVFLILASSVAARDHTRVFVLSIFPALLVILISQIRDRRILLHEMQMCEIAAWCIPPVALWQSDLLPSFNLVLEALKVFN